jgi:hypothetical protein
MIKNNPLSQFSANVTSQFGEDGILKRIFEIMPDSDKWCVEFGAWDGKFLSNCYNLLANFEWRGVMIEANKTKFKALKKTYENNSNTCLINLFVNFEGKNKLDNLLKKIPIPKNFDLLSIDIDGNDYYIWESLKDYSPKVVVIEFNPTIPSDIEFIQKRDFKINQSSSILSINKLGRAKGYELIGTTECNAIFVKAEYFRLFGIENNDPAVLWDKEIDPPRVFQLFDGTLVLTKEFELWWNGIKVDKYDLQKLPKFYRFFIDSQGIKGVLRKFLFTLYKKLNNN